MTPEQFAYWLQGCAELNPEMDAPSPAQWQAIKDHLATVFVKTTPPFQINPGRSTPELTKQLQDYLRVNPLGSPLQITC